MVRSLRVGNLEYAKNMQPVGTSAHVEDGTQYTHMSQEGRMPSDIHTWPWD